MYFTHNHLKIFLKNSFPFIPKVKREGCLLKEQVLEIKMKKKR